MERSKPDDPEKSIWPRCNPTLTSHFVSHLLAHVMNSGKGTLDELRIDRSALSEPKPKGPWIVGLLAGLVLIAFGAWWLMRPKALAVRVVLAKPGADASPIGGGRTVLNASGYVMPRREATISSKVTGKVTEVLVEEGKRVEKGQVLARLDDSNIRSTLRLAEAQLTSAKSALEEIKVRLKEANLALRRATQLTTNGISTQADFEAAEAGAAAQQARLRRQEADIAVAEQDVAVWQQQLDDTVIRAPFAGIVTSKNAQPGEMISPMSAGGFTRTGICTIVDMDSLEVEVDVNEGYINRVQAGQPVEAKLDAYSDWIIPCHVVAIIPTADRQKATVKVRVGFDKLDPRILPQMAVKVSFRGGEGAGIPSKGTVSLPRAALQSADGKDFIFVVQNEKAERRAVTVGSTRNEEAEILTGVTAGERVIIEPPAGVADGQLVRISNP